MKLNVLSVFLLISTLVFWSASCQQSSTVNSNSSTETNFNSAENSSISSSSNKTNQTTVKANVVNKNTTPNKAEEVTDSEPEGMLESSPDADKQPYDLQFIDTMIQHHQAAIVMAKMVLAKSKNQELRKFAQKIISVQETEIEKMESWRDQWYQFNLDAINMKLPGMTDSMRRMVGKEMDKMEVAEGKEFDEYFFQMMIPHHQGAVLMAKDALQKAEHPEIKKIAGNIISSQEAEIEQMQNWKKS